MNVRLLRRRFLATAALLLSWSLPSELRAQSGAGSILGTVRDSQAASIPGAKVEIRQVQTSYRFSTQTNESGYFSFPSVGVGAYEINVDAAGMEKWRGELTLQTGQVASLDIALRVASTETSVTVVGDVTPLVTTTSGTLASTVERSRIEQLPLNGRYVYNLLGVTTPGVEQSLTPRLYGLRYALEFYQDGAIISDRNNNQLPRRSPGLDTIQEYRVETSNSSAKMNRPGSVIITTRSGTNQLHGSTFLTHRNSGFGLARRREDFFSTPPQLIRNEFGATLGGPVVIPKLYNGRNRTFFFVSYEGFRLRQDVTRQTSVPTEAMRAGDFSGLVDGAGRLFTIYDPWSTATAPTWTRAPFPGNRIPSQRLSPLAAYLYSVTPLPNSAVNPLVGANWTGTGFSDTDQNTVTARADHRFTDRDQFFARFSWNPHDEVRTNAPIDAGGATSPTTLDGRANAFGIRERNVTGTASWTHTFSPTFFSETLFSHAFFDSQFLPAAGLGNIAGELGLPNPFNGGGFPRLRDTGFGMTYDGGINYSLTSSHLMVIDQNFTKVAGRHELWFGGRFRREVVDSLVDQTEQAGNHSFNTSATGLFNPASGSAYSAQPFTGHPSANLHLGIGAYNARLNRPWFFMRQSERALYFQDNWRVNSRLNLNLGLRWEWNSPGRERDNSLISYDPATLSIVLGQPVDRLIDLGLTIQPVVDAFTRTGARFVNVGDSSLPKYFMRENYWDFGPRAGFAYRLGSLQRPTVLRGGYSLYAFPEGLRNWNGTMAQNAPTQAILSNNPNSATDSPDGLPNYALRSVPTVVAGQNSSNAIDISRRVDIARGNGVMHFFNPDQPTNRVHELNFTVEREVAPDTVVRASYVGTYGFRLSQWWNLNEAIPTYVWLVGTGTPLPTGEFANVARRPLDQTTLGTIREYRKTGWSNGNTFQFEVQRRYAKGLAFQAFYVLSNVMRVGGDGWRDDLMLPAGYFLPGAAPQDDKDRNRFLNYRRDISIPKHRFNWNWLWELPVGRGKLLLPNAGRFTNLLLGGWQLAGNGELFSRYFTLPITNWGTLRDVEVSGTQHKVQDCRSGTCFDGYLWYNGYIPANRVNSTAANGAPNGVMNVPSNYVPAHQPIHPTPAQPIPGDPNASLYETNNVTVRLNNGTTQLVGVNTFLHPWRNQYLPAPAVLQVNASLFKSVPIGEKVQARFNVDFFNVLNNPGLVLPDAITGIVSTRTSNNAPRVLQATLRLTF
jgi:hypothetical protein